VSFPDPRGTEGYLAQPGLMCLSVCPSIRTGLQILGIERKMAQAKQIESEIHKREETQYSK
jgi:hypothetical protein